MNATTTASLTDPHPPRPSRLLQQSLVDFDEEFLRSELIQAAGHQLTQVADSSSQSIEHQLGIIRHSSASFEDIRQRMHQVQCGICDVGTCVDSVVETAGRNSEELEEISRKMQALERRFDSISGLVRTINEIADRTNLLSLNATIEAARAGSAGRGFAVVAGEVKELCATTKAANCEIDETLRMVGDAIADLSSSVGESVKQMRDSVEAVRATRETTSMIRDATAQFSTQLQASCDGLRQLDETVHRVEHETSEVRTIGRTFSYLMELMTMQQSSSVSVEPLKRLEPLIVDSSFHAPERFREREPEYVLQEDDVLISATDTRGRITFANSRFCEIAEYEPAQMIGQPHNMIRHPEMPRTAFADLWSVIRKGNLWQGFIANRSGRGRLYWVKAHVFPCFENGEIVGYISVRTRPTRHEIQRVVEAYRVIP